MRLRAESSRSVRHVEPPPRSCRGAFGEPLVRPATHGLHAAGVAAAVPFGVDPRAHHKPRQAWPEPAWEVQRIDFDYAYALASANGLVYYSSSSDHAVHALDLATGVTRWRYFTEGPVRLAPTVHGGRVFFASDDGHVYCLDGRSGQLIWKHRPRIPDERLVGNDQIICRHPARSGVLVDGDRAYTTFGMLSPEGIVVTCLEIQTGEVIWQNETSGTRYATQPHFEAMGGVSPQGYLALCEDVLVVPCGRATPAFFDSDTGELLYHEAEGLFPGGAWTMTFGDLTFTPCEYLKKPNPELPDASEAKISEEATLVALHAATGEEVFHLRGALRGVVTDRRDPESDRKGQADQRRPGDSSRSSAAWLPGEVGQFRRALCGRILHPTLGDSGRPRLRVHPSRFHADRRDAGCPCLLRCVERPAGLGDFRCGRRA